MQCPVLAVALYVAVAQFYDVEARLALARSLDLGPADALLDLGSSAGSFVLAAASLGAIGRDIDVLVATNNGVTDRSSSTLLTAPAAWEELLPLRRVFPTFARFRPSARTGGLVVERAARFAHWLTVQPQTGMRHMLQLTLKAVTQPEVPAAASAEMRGLMRQALPMALVRLPAQQASKPAGCVGLHALEVHTPRHCVRATELEAELSVAGKYTQGLLMREWAACDEDEDVVSMALTAVRRLIERHGVRHADVGMLHVASESLLDRSKSIKSHLMSLFEPHGCTNVEGVDGYHACYGGTAALFACTNWVESSAWDGRWAIAVCTDVSDAPKQYPFMNGAACVAMLVLSLIHI